jgi:hypothetical protein
VLDIPPKIKGFRSRPINKLIDVASRTYPQQGHGTRLTQWPDGFSVSGIDNPYLAPAYHFECEQLSSDSVRVRAGIWTVCVGTSEYDVGLLCPGTGGTPRFDGEYFAIVGSIAASGYIIGTLTGGANPGSTQPTTLTASWSATYPSRYTTSPIVVFGKVTVTSGVITAVEQLWNGGDITDKPTVLDGVSLDYIATVGTTKNRAQAFQWDTLANGVWASGDGMFTRPTAKGAGKYIPITELATGLTTAAASGGGGWNGTNGPWNAAGATVHANLDFLTSASTVYTGTANRQHSKQYSEIGGTYTGDATTHYGAAAFVSIGRADYSKAIDLDNSQLCNGAGTALVDFDAAALTDFLAAGTVKISNATDIGAYTALGLGSLVVVGGASFVKKVRVEDTTVWNGSTPTGAFQVLGGAFFGNTSGCISPTNSFTFGDTTAALSARFQRLVAATQTVDMCDANYGINVTAGNGINVVGTGSYYHGGTPGNSVGSAFSGGIFTGTGFSLLAGVYLYDNNGVPLAGPVSILVKS